MNKIVKANILSNQKISEKYGLLKVHAPEIARQIQPGQFVMIKTEDSSTSPLLNAPLSVHDVNEDSLVVLYQILGQKTQKLSQKKADEKLTVIGPLGNGFDASIKNKNIILVAGGCGIAPLLFLSKKLIENNNQVTLFFGAANKDLIVRQKAFEQVGAKFFIATDDGSAGSQGNVITLFSQHLNDEKPATVYASGPQAMLLSLVTILKQNNLSGQLSFESYMACGFGACFGCTVKTNRGNKLCCKDGPVFNLENFI